MVRDYRNRKNVSIRIRKVLLRQDNKCIGCGKSLDAGNLYEASKGLKCGACVLGFSKHAGKSN